MVTILHADDDSGIRTSMALFLRGSGHRVISFSDGSTALSALHDGCRPDLLITDLRMPMGDGYSLINGLESSGFVLPVLVYSHDFFDSSKVRYSGRVHYVSKSARLPILRSALESALAP